MIGRRFRLLATLVSVLLVTVIATAVQAGVGGETTSTATPQKVDISGIDMTVIAVYLVGIVLLGCFAGMRRKESRGSDYFLAGKSLSWPVIGLALFATNISTLHLVSFAQNGYTSGLVYGNYEWMAAFTLIILSLFFAPFYLRSAVATLPDFMEKRFSRGSRDFLAVLSIFSAIAVHIGFSLHTGAIVLEGTLLESYGISPETAIQYRWLTVLCLCGVTALYTIIGGLLAVVWTESIQTIVLLVGSIFITVIGFQMIGGWGELTASVHPVNFSMLRDANDPTATPWYAIMLGYPVLGVWYWCTDQTIVQRVLGAKDENHARVGPLFAGFVKILPVFLFVLPGLICLGLVNLGHITDLPTHADGSPLTERTYTHMITHMLDPARIGLPGLRGLVLAAMLAALMSTVSGALNSIATLVSYDIYKRFKPAADDRHLIRVGRLATFAAMLIAVVWSLMISRLGKTIFQEMVDIFPAVAPPTAAVFLWGVFWKRTSSRAALWTLMGGPLVGILIYALNKSNALGFIDLTSIAPPIGPAIASFVSTNGLLMAFILFVAESVFIVVVSTIWPHEHTEESRKLVWSSPLEALRAKETTWRGLLDFRILSAVLVVTMVGLYWCFAPSDVYYPFQGKVTLSDDRPVVGAMVSLECEADPRLNAHVLTGPDGTFKVGTPGRAGGAPAGTVYRVHLEPTGDLLTRQTEKGPELLALVPGGHELTESTEQGKRIFTFQLDETEAGRRVVEVATTDVTKRLPMTPIPERYRAAETSPLELTVNDKMEPYALKLD